MAGRKRDEELVVITKTYDFILWSCNHKGRFLRNHRFVPVERIELNCRPVGPLVRVWGPCTWPDGLGYWKGWPVGPERIERGPFGRNTLRFRTKGPFVRIAWPKAKRRARSTSPIKSPRPNGPTVRFVSFEHWPNVRPVGPQNN